MEASEAEFGITRSTLRESQRIATSLHHHHHRDAHAWMQ